MSWPQRGHGALSIPASPGDRDGVGDGDSVQARGEIGGEGEDGDRGALGSPPFLLILWSLDRSGLMTASLNAWKIS